MMANTGSKRRWMPVILGVSLAINLAVAAALGGAALRHQGDERGGGGPRGGAKGSAIFMKALPHEARQAIREEIKTVPRAASGGVDAMLEALRREPFDHAAAMGVLEAQRDTGAQQQRVVSAAWLAQVAAMSVEERAAYADRIEAFEADNKVRKKER
ncbi:periplasmic heavy metal sensor [Sulfitobacter guttiformis]|uniref:Heavy-metal resistance protein n=1 Tax=Sulfitobacter guttiformis TaxID=74349 RepID=A0A420DNR1_9RHOB|nr:periplasmic heavy metal sensor [Sulfitobacter guttiformis]KIN73217.1 RNA polymerase sigma-70 factor [Sulfitobacter guttiformis KCTC 32187]RKE95892.1 heavy-metal resistance protein [Sulfitobacter guttiformis]